MHAEPIGAVMSSVMWTDEVLNWFEKKDLERPRALKPNVGYEWLRKGKANGPLLGGCITSMLHLRGTKFLPDFAGTIFFWEIPESDGDFMKGESPANIDAHLADLENSGIFADIAGMIVGRPFAYTQKETVELKKIILDRTQSYDFPILFNADIGHTDPIITVPLGVAGEIDSSKNLFAMLETGVS